MKNPNVNRRAGHRVLKVTSLLTGAALAVGMTTAVAPRAAADGAGPCVTGSDAGVGWDGPTGLGTPNGTAAF